MTPTEEPVNEAPVDQKLVALDAEWKYLDNGIAPAPAWTSPGYNDDAWSQGPAQLGYGDGDEATVVNEGPAPDRHITTWFRTGFNLDDPADVAALRLGLVRDDGAAVYLNGIELVRDNLPAGPLTAQTRAASYAWGPAETEPHYFVVPAEALVAGENVLAVEVHSTDPGSRDLSFALELIGLAP